MKKIVLLLVLSVVIISCKNNSEANAEDTATDGQNVMENAASGTLFKGEFIYTADAAVLKGSNFIYGVNPDEMATELANRVKPVKREDFDMVPVVVRGTLANKAEGVEGWDQILTITEIVEVSDTPSEADIKIEEKKS